MWNDPRNPSAGISQIPGYSGNSLTPAQRSEAILAFNDAAAIDEIVADLRSRFESGPGTTRGVLGALDYLPTASNRGFNDAGQRARGYVKRALGFTSGEGNTLAESEALYGPFIPRAGDTDQQILDKITALQNLGAQARDRARLVLGGEPDANGNIVPVAPQQGADGNATGPSVFDQTYVNGGPAAMQASGSTGQTSIPIPPEMQAEFRSWLLANAGTMTPETYNAFRQGLDRKYGFGEGGDYTAEGQRQIEAIQSGGTLNLTIPNASREMSGGEQFRNDLVDNRAGAALFGAANMGGMGLVEAFDPERAAALRGEYPGWTTAGEIGGAMLGASMLGAFSRNAIQASLGKAAPNLASRLLTGGAGRGGQFGRNLATDVAYSGGYGAITGDNPLESAAEGGVGSVAGQLLGRGLGRAVGGVQLDPAVQYLRQRGIPLTTGQTLGDFTSRLEQRAASLPLVSDMIRARRIDAETGLNMAALNDAGQSIGFTPTRIGREGIADLMGDPAAQTRGAINDAFDNAVAGRTFSQDAPLINDVNAAAARATRLTPELRDSADQALRNTFDPLANNNAISGQEWQSLRSDLAGYRAGQTGPGFPAQYRGIMDDAIGALDSLATRQGGPEVVQGLQNANRAYRLGNVVRDAAYRADGSDYRFTASQLQDAVKASQRKFPGDNPLLDLADNAQRVMGQSVPNSGTADRLMQAGAFTGLAGIGGTIGLATGGDAQSAGTGAAIPTAAMILAALGGTRQGQRLINASLTRPAGAQRLGEAVRRNSGLFGSGAIPLVLTRD